MPSMVFSRVVCILREPCTGDLEGDLEWPWRVEIVDTEE